MIYAVPLSDQASEAACGHEPFHCSTDAQKTATCDHAHVLCHSTKGGLIIAESSIMSKPPGKVRKFDSSIRYPS